MTATGGYSRDFYDATRGYSERSAGRIVPELVSLVHPRSVVDVGCGTGHWLRAFLDSGVERVLGIDGHHVPAASLDIPVDRFRAMDLTRIQPVDERFDLAVSVEVAEHLPAESAASFVAFVAGLAPVVVFSAAIPGQGGVGHVNEQWPGYWADLFERHSYRAVDCLRARFWEDPAVTWWYAQNLFVYASYEALGRLPDLQAAIAAPPMPVRLVHPNAMAARDRPLSLGQLVRALPGAAQHSLTYRRRHGRGRS